MAGGVCRLACVCRVLGRRLCARRCLGGRRFGPVWAVGAAISPRFANMSLHHRTGRFFTRLGIRPQGALSARSSDGCRREVLSLSRGKDAHHRFRERPRGDSGAAFGVRRVEISCLIGMYLLGSASELEDRSGPSVDRTRARAVCCRGRHERSGGTRGGPVNDRGVFDDYPGGARTPERASRRRRRGPD